MLCVMLDWFDPGVRSAAGEEIAGESDPQQQRSVARSSVLNNSDMPIFSTNETKNESAAAAASEESYRELEAYVQGMAGWSSCRCHSSCVVQLKA